MKTLNSLLINLGNLIKKYLGGKLDRNDIVTKCIEIREEIDQLKERLRIDKLHNETAIASVFGRKEPQALKGEDEQYAYLMYFLDSIKEGIGGLAATVSGDNNLEKCKEWLPKDYNEVIKEFKKLHYIAKHYLLDHYKDEPETNIVLVREIG